MKLSANMVDTLRAIWEHEHAGLLGADPDRYSTRTIVALTKRDLIKPNVDGSVRLTSSGRRAVGPRPYPIA